MQLDPRRPDDPIVWRVDVNRGVDSGTWSTPAIHGDTVIWPTKPGVVYGLDRATGAERWQLRVAGPVFELPRRRRRRAPARVTAAERCTPTTSRPGPPRRSSGGPSDSTGTSSRRRPCGRGGSMPAPGLATWSRSVTHDGRVPRGRVMASARRATATHRSAPRLVRTARTPSPADTDTRIAVALAEPGRRAPDSACSSLRQIPIGASWEHHGFPGLFSITNELLADVLVDIARSADWACGWCSWTAMAATGRASTPRSTGSPTMVAPPCGGRGRRRGCPCGTDRDVDHARVGDRDVGG